MTVTVAIYLFDNMEVLDFAGPFEVFTTASRMLLRMKPESSAPFTVVTVARRAGLIQARAGLKVYADHTFESCPPCDFLLIPGGVIDNEINDSQVISWIQERAATADITASVCTGAFLLAGAGLLNNKSATTHWEDVADFRSRFPKVSVRENVRWVDEGKIVSSAGIAAGIDMSLHLVARIAGNALASATAKQMDVPYKNET